MATEICLYGDIGKDWWSEEGIDEVMVLEALQTLDPSAVKHTVRINSPGGNVDTGLAILTLLRSHAAQMKATNDAFQLETSCDGYAMSSASVIFMAGDIRTVALGGVVMIHDAWTCCYGNATEMTKMVGVLDKLSQNTANIYAALCTPAGKDQPERSADYYRALMKEETYLIGNEAVDIGLATNYDKGQTASLLAALSPEKLKGKYVETMTKHYQRRTFTQSRSSKSLTDAREALRQLKMLEATL